MNINSSSAVVLIKIIINNDARSIHQPLTSINIIFSLLIPGGLSLYKTSIIKQNVSHFVWLA